MSAPEKTVPSQPEEIIRVEVRPGLTMVRRRTLKPDGRYLLYYDFERDPSPASVPCGGEPAVEL